MWPVLIDELDIFDRAISAAAIAGIYNAGAVGKCRDNLPDPPCFSVIPAFSTGGGTAAVDMCIYECDARAQCSTSCALKDDPGFVEVVDACLSGASFNACVQVDTYDRENGCNNICPLPQGEADFVVCGDGGCFRHNSETGALAEVFMERPYLGICRNTERHVFFHPNGDFWMYNVRNSQSEICIYDGPEWLEQTFDLPEPCDASGCTVDELNQRPSFAITDWVATAQGNVYAVANGTCRSLGATVCQGWDTYMWRKSSPSPRTKRLSLTPTRPAASVHTSWLVIHTSRPSMRTRSRGSTKTRRYRWSEWSSARRRRVARVCLHSRI